MNTQILKTKTYIKKDGMNKDGNAPIYMNIITNNTDTSFSTGYFVNPERWKLTDGFRTKTKNKEEIDLRTELNNDIKKLEGICEELAKENQQFSAQMVKNIFLGKGQITINKSMTILQALEYHKKYFMKEKVTIKVQDGYTVKEAEKDATLSHNKYVSMKGKLIEYLKDEHNLTDIPLDRIDDKFQQEFLLFLQGSGLGVNTSIRYFKAFNYIFKFCVKKKLIPAYPFIDDFKVMEKDSDTESLTIDELNKMIGKEFKTERLEQMRDIFVFLCLTGYSFCDYRTLTNDKIKNENGETYIEGTKIIFHKRKKSKVAQNIPLLPITQQLIDKYANHPDCVTTGCLMPLKSAKCINEYIKEIATLCEIDKLLTTRVARKTFGSILSNAGTHTKTVSKLLGHSRIQTTEKFYIKTETKPLVQGMEHFNSVLKVA